MAGAPSQSQDDYSQPDNDFRQPQAPIRQPQAPISYKLQLPTQHRQPRAPIRQPQAPISHSQAPIRQMLIKLRESSRRQRPEIETVLKEVISTPIVDKSSLEMQKKNVKKIQDKFSLLFRAITALAGMLGAAYLLGNLNKIRSSLDDRSPVVSAIEKNGQIHVIENKIPEFVKNSYSSLDEFELCLSELDKLVT